MNSTKILIMFLGFYTLFALLIFTAGVGETIRLESFSIVDNNVWGNYSYECINKSQTTSGCTAFNTSELTSAFEDYEEFKSQYIFTNTPFIQLINFFGLIGILYFVYLAFMEGWEYREASVGEIFRGNHILLIFLLYLGSIVFNYLQSVFVNQLIVVLFQDIYSSIYMFQLMTNYFFFFILFGFFIIWLANQIRHIDSVGTR